MTIKQEDFTNRAVAKVPQQQCLSADYEQRGGRKKMDVVFQDQSLRVVVEAETSLQRRGQPVENADARLSQHLTTAAFAVCYTD